MKKFTSLLFLLWVALGTFAYDFEVNGIFYQILSSTDKTVGVTFQTIKERPEIGNKRLPYAPYSGDMSIPSNVEHGGVLYSVERICSGAFLINRDIQSVTLPQTIKVIEGESFSGSSIKTINLPNSLIEIGQFAFGGCRSLRGLTIPTSVTSIGSGAFDGCSFVYGKFINNSNVVSSDNSWESWSSISFYQCETENGLLIDNDTVKAFRNEVKDIIIPEGITTIGGGAFANYPVTSIKLPNTLVRIGTSAFCGCSNLIEVEFPNYLKEIENSAFRETNLTSIRIPRSIEKMGSWVFHECDNLTTIIFEAENCQYEDGKESPFPASVNKVTIGEYVTTIPAYFFSKTGISALRIPASVKNIGQNAFANCKNLTNVNIIGNTLESIEAQAFLFCSNLTSVTLPESTDFFGDHAFYGCM